VSCGCYTPGSLLREYFMRVVILSDQAFAFVFADRIGHEVLSKKAARSIAPATHGGGVACGDWFGPQVAREMLNLAAMRDS
jgi:hypothetical protein